MPPALRRFALTAHVTSSVSMLGAVAAFLVLAIVGLAGGDPWIARGVYVAMHLIAWYVLVPLICAALVTGLIQALGTPWGLFRHYWILAKLLVTVFVGLVLALQLQPISYVADSAVHADLSHGDLGELRVSFVVHAAGGLMILLIPVALSLYKPRGMTRYGWRKQYERPAES